jgi:iron complex outermembrane receptor protein
MLYDAKRGQLILTTNLSKNFRAPTLNDRYWQNAGREDVKPETSHSAEMGLSFIQSLIKINSKAFYQLIDQWIQWVPDANGVYRPENIKQVKARGIEASTELQWKSDQFSIHSKITYQFTRSTTRKVSDSEVGTIGKQLIYTPIHTGSAFASTQFKTWTFNVFAQYSGQRFTEASNSSAYALDPFVLVDFAIGKSFVLKRNDMSLHFSLKNAFNENYQLYSGRAMPGRYFNIQFSYQLKQKQI